MRVTRISKTISRTVFGLMCSAVVAQQAAPVHAPDGGTRERLESLTIPAEANAPFSATVTTEWTKILVDGSKQTNWNHRTIARDSSGRVFQERRFFTPTGDKVATMLTELDYADPNRHELYICRPQMKVCYESAYNPPPVEPAQVRMMPNRTPSSPVKTEDLGHRNIDGVDTEGSREIVTIAQGRSATKRKSRS
jgi:hypothetical protein